MGSIIENHTDRKEIINLLCILFILGSSFLSYIIPSLKSQIFSIGLTLFGYICFIFTNWILLKRFCLSHKLIKYFILYVLSNLIYNPQIQISAESETKRSIFREKDKTKRSKKESAQHSKSRNKSFVMTSVSAL